MTGPLRVAPRGLGEQCGEHALHLLDRLPSPRPQRRGVQHRAPEVLGPLPHPAQRMPLRQQGEHPPAQRGEGRLLRAALPDGADVVVAGGGPVGLMLACELALAEIPVIVLERLTEVDTTIKAGSVKWNSTGRPRTVKPPSPPRSWRSPCARCPGCRTSGSTRCSRRPGSRTTRARYRTTAPGGYYWPVTRPMCTRRSAARG
ncbi:hypothetical protein CP981_09680 [Streptomyces platensis]|uniref:FAD-binding domain-containing protein n=1 Tax=Streptomyces platensis TaxID=58346 RepID=A0AAE6NGV6_STRPT|nr:hypothetical protein CP981_09680 [Streptomyces platensis]